MDIKTLSRNPQKITLKETITTEELHRLMTERWTPEMPGPFKFKKGLFGKSVKFSVYMQIVTSVSAKGNVVFIRRSQQSTTVGGTDFKDLSQRMDAAKEGGLKAAALGGVQRFVDIVNAMKEILKDKM